MLKKLTVITAIILATSGASGVSASTLQFDMLGTGSGTTDTVEVSFTIETGLTGTGPTNTLGFTTFDPVAALTAFSVIERDSSGNVLNTLGADTSLAGLTISQTRVNQNLGVPQPGSNTFAISFNGGPALTGSPGGFLNLTLGSSGFGSFFGPPDPIPDVLFDDPTRLLNTVTTALDIDNLNPSTGISSTAIGNFRFTSVTVSDPSPVAPPNVIPLPASLPLLLAGLGAFGILRRRRG